MAAEILRMHAIEMRQFPYCLCIGGGIPRYARRLHAEKWLEEGIIDRSLHSVPLMQSTLLEVGLLPGSRRFFEGELRRRLYTQLLAVDINGRCVLRLAKHESRHSLGHDVVIATVVGAFGFHFCRLVMLF